MSESSTGDRTSGDGPAVAGGMTLTMSESVVAVIAGLAARKVTGVLALSDATPAVDPQRGYAFSDTTPGVVAAVGETEATVSLSLVAEYGTDLVELVSEVRRDVASAVLQMTALQVKDVDITVSDVQVPSRDAGPTGRDR